MRKELTGDKYQIAIGKDHVLGNFIQVFDLKDMDNPIIDEDGIDVDTFLKHKEEYLNKYIPDHEERAKIQCSENRIQKMIEREERFFNEEPCGTSHSGPFIEYC